MSENNNNTNEAMDSSDPAASHSNAATSWKLSIKTPKEKRDISIDTSATVQQVSVQNILSHRRALLRLLVEGISGQ